MKDTLVIIIDAVNAPEGIKSSVPLIENIVDFLNSPEIGAAVLASYGCTKELFIDNLWNRNRKKYIPKYIIQGAVVHYLKHTPGTDQTHPKLLNYTDNEIDQIALTTVSELNFYLENINPHITKIFLVGAAWDRCIKLRNLGYINLQQNLSKKKHYDIFVDTRYMVDSTGQIPCITEPDWVKINDTLYQYSL